MGGCLSLIRIASRKSALAKWQAHSVGAALLQAHPQIKIEYVYRESLGDTDLTSPLWKMTSKGVFTEDFVRGLIEDEYDLVVHSWKDLPTEERLQTEVVATMRRAAPQDLLLIKEKVLREKTTNLRIFSSSPRREKNLKPLLPKILPWKISSISFDPVRGNIQTRMNKTLETEEIHGWIVAKAALDRLEITTPGLIPVELPLSENPTAAAQGALAIEIRKGREDVKQLLQSIHCTNTWQEVQAEREILKSHGGGCHLALGISVLQREYGVIQYIQGETKEPSLVYKPKISLGSFSEEELFSSSQVSFFERRDLPLSPTDIELLRRNPRWYVAKHSALTEELKKLAQVLKPEIRVAGLRTWMKLASEGILVQSCDDSLGETSDIDLYIKITHLSSAKGKNELASYELIPQFIDFAALNISWDKIKCCYWKSASQFSRAWELIPQIHEAQHCSGPGYTAKHIENITGKKSFIYPSEEIWWNQVRNSSRAPK